MCTLKTKTPIQSHTIDKLKPNNIEDIRYQHGQRRIDIDNIAKTPRNQLEKLKKNAIENTNSKKNQMVYKHMKSCSTSIVIGGMQNKLYHLFT